MIVRFRDIIAARPQFRVGDRIIVKETGTLGIVIKVVPTPTEMFYEVKLTSGIGFTESFSEKEIKSAQQSLFGTKFREGQVVWINSPDYVGLGQIRKVEVDDEGNFVSTRPYFVEYFDKSFNPEKKNFKENELRLPNPEELKSPYKVGDKVRLSDEFSGFAGNSIYKITKIDNPVWPWYYVMVNDYGEETLTAYYEIQPVA